MLSNSSTTRNLSKSDLGGVIFGCTQGTIRECLVDQLFGLPGQHMSYVQNIEPGLPLFLFNYSDRKLYGIFEAESHGQLNINPYGWSSNGSDRTKYSAQVRIRTRMQCEPLMENQFKPIIADNYYTSSRFCFEVDRFQASALTSLFGSAPVIGGSAKWIPKVAPNLDAPLKVKDLTPLVSEAVFSCLDQCNTNPGVLSDSYHCQQNQLPETYSIIEEEENEEHRVYLKLKKLAVEREDTNSSPMDYKADITVPRKFNTERSEYKSDPETGASNRNEETITPDFQLVIHQLTQGMKELKTFSEGQLQQASLLEKKMAESKLEIQRLKCRVQLLESRLDPSTTCAGETLAKTFDLNHFSGDDQIYLLGGYNGCSWLSALDCYSLPRDVLRSLQPMSAVRSHAAAAVLNGQIYIFGGGVGDKWYDTVESYNPLSDEWTSRPSLNVEKGNLAGATLNGKLFAIGGGNRDTCLSDVEMFDPSLGRWVYIQSMLQKRFAPASTVLNGALYVSGGYDGEYYLNTAERFDPRAISWESVGSMSTNRGCHCLVGLNEKLYAFGGYDGEKTVASVEVLDPRFGSWTACDPMNRSRGYAGGVVIGESIFVIGGVQSGPNIQDTVECYKDGSGWLLAKSSAVGKRCFFSAVVV